MFHDIATEAGVARPEMAPLHSATHGVQTKGPEPTPTFLLMEQLKQLTVDSWPKRLIFFGPLPRGGPSVLVFLHMQDAPRCAIHFGTGCPDDLVRRPYSLEDSFANSTDVVPGVAYVRACYKSCQKKWMIIRIGGWRTRLLEHLI